jgi:predicted Fe-Mo cluster-binding NifX family protein
VKIAIPLFGNRVSPRFDCAPQILIVTVELGSTPQRQHMAAVDWTATERVGRLKALNVNTIICGGIDRWSADALRAAGVRVQNSVTGDAEEVLADWIRSEVMA